MNIVINNEVRRALELSVIQYSVMEYISIKATESGYSKPKEDIAEALGLTRSVVYVSIKALQDAELLNKSNNGRILMPTSKWKNMFSTEPLREPVSEDFKKDQLLECYFDGGCEPVNPGGNMGMGWIIVNSSTGHVRNRKRYKAATSTNSNNVAEYLALYMLLKDLRDYQDCNITIYGDSKLVVNQINDEWELNSGLHYNIAKRTMELYSEVIKKNVINVSWIPRERNTGADALATEAIETLRQSIKKPKKKRSNFVRN